MIPISNESKAQSFIQRMGWNHKDSGSDQACVDICPLCTNSNSKFYINTSAGEKDGLYQCHVCGESGNLYQLKERLGVTTPGLVSMKDAASSSNQPSALPNFDTLHKQLLKDGESSPWVGDVLDYLLAERKLTVAVLERMKIGCQQYDGKSWVVIPYFNSQGVPVFYKARSVPPADKAFRAPSGREAPLFNESAIKPGLEELVMVEGEIDCLTLLSQGYESVVGVPGANVKKAAWIDKLDKVAPKVIYTLYDSDKVGQKAAREIATRIGLEKVRNICLPPFEVNGMEIGPDAAPFEVKVPGKDINEWFRAGHTMEEFEQLKAEAKQFPVQGVQSVVDVMYEIRDELDGKTIAAPTYDSPWPSLNKRIGGVSEGDLVGIMAEGKVGKTTMALNWLDYFSVNDVPSFLYCLEMPPKRLVRKWLSLVTQTDDTPGKSLITSATVDLGMEIAGKRSADLLFGFTNRKTEIVFETIYQAVRRYGIKCVCFDNLQMLVQSITNFQQETSKITKDFKSMLMELKLIGLLIIQPHRVKEGEIISARNAHGSSGIEKDVDCMICLHRNRVGKIKEQDFHGYMDTDENFEPELLVRADLTRYSPGGTCTLYMDGATSTVRELTSSDVETAGSKAPNQGIQVEQLIEA